MMAPEYKGETLMKRLIAVMFLVCLIPGLSVTQSPPIPAKGVWFDLTPNPMKAEKDNEFKADPYFYGMVDCLNSWTQFVFVSANTNLGQKTPVVIEKKRILSVEVGDRPQILITTENNLKFRLPDHEKKKLEGLFRRMSEHNHSGRRKT